MSPISTRFTTLQRLTLLLFFGAVAALAWWLWDLSLLSSQGVLQAVAEHPLLAPLAFVGAYALALLFMIPTLPLNLGAGFLWGPLLGALYTQLGATLGAVCAFLFARTAFGQPMAREFHGKVLGRLAASMENGGWRVVAFTRLNPAVPTSIVNFLFGLTSLRLWTYTWATFAFCFPLSYAVSYLGYTTGGFMLDGDTSRMVRIAALSLGIGLLVYGGRQLLRDRAGDGAARPGGS